MKRLHVATLLVTGCAFGIACSDSSAPASSEDGIVVASEATRQALGVSRWSTKNAPASIDGYDEAGETVVSLRHALRTDATMIEHAFVLRERAHEAATQVAISTDAEGLQTFTVLRADANDDAFVGRVLVRMQEDLQPKTTSLASNRLRTADVPWTEPSVELVCGDASSQLVNGADTCMSHKTKIPQEAKAWALACNDYLAKHPGATREGTACRETGLKPCTCVDPTRMWFAGEGGNLCRYQFAGVGQEEPAQNCDDPTKKCPKMVPKCMSRAEWCRAAGEPDDC